jgi:hypothetical protein
MESPVVRAYFLAGAGVEEPEVAGAALELALLGFVAFLCFLCCVVVAGAALFCFCGAGAGVLDCASKPTAVSIEIKINFFMVSFSFSFWVLFTHAFMMRRNCNLGDPLRKADFLGPGG